MPLTVDDLDGKYVVKSETSHGGEYIVNGDGETEIRNGLTFRKDKNGFIWESTFSIVGSDQVQMESTLDPSHADKFVKDDKGNLTKSMTVYKTILTAETVGGKLTLRGVIEHAGEKTRLYMVKTG